MSQSHICAICGLRGDIPLSIQVSAIICLHQGFISLKERRNKDCITALGVTGMDQTCSIVELYHEQIPLFIQCTAFWFLI